MSLIASDQFRIVVGLGKSGMSLVRFLARQGVRRTRARIRWPPCVPSTRRWKCAVVNSTSISSVAPASST